jgi:LPS sulfotransferase NodH
LLVDARVSMRIEQDLAEAYRKNARDEAFLDKLNRILAPFNDEEYADVPEDYPTLHVIGVPRSGTTLLSQLISSHLDVGYINHLIAAFWRAPIYGIRLSRKVLPPRMPSTFQSDFGRTAHIYEPHEFGYFWSQLLGYQEMLQQDAKFEESIDWNRVALVLKNMTHAFERPIVFKSFLLGWHIARIQQVLPKTCFVRVRRDPLQSAISLLKMREQFLGSAEKWASFKPAEYSWLKGEPYWKQIAGQVYYLDQALSEQIRQAGGRNVLEVTYEELCREPRQVLNQVRDLLEQHGVTVGLTSEPPASFEMTQIRTELREDYLLLERGINAFFGT